MTNLEVLIRELVAIDRLATSTCEIGSQHLNRDHGQVSRESQTIALGEVTTLNHEILNDAVKGRAFIAIALLSRSESSVSLRSMNIPGRDNRSKEYARSLPEILRSLEREQESVSRNILRN